MDHPHPLPGWLQFYVERYIGREPLWRFPEFPPASGLSFERLGFENHTVVLPLFSGDPDPFVSANFKSPGEFYEYVANLRICGPYSPKHGAADWIIRTAEAAPAGLLHVYDISREECDFNHRRCSIGYTVAERFRGTGLAQHAVRALQRYLFERHGMLMLLAMPDRLNERSARFLVRLGYEDRSPDYVCPEEYRYFELYRDAEARQRIMAGREARRSVRSNTLTDDPLEL